MIWWLASYPKSGNTWLRAFLASYRADGRSVDLNHLDGFSIDDVQSVFYQLASPKPLDDCDQWEIQALRLASFVNILEIYRRGPVFMKTHCANVHLEGIPQIPRGKPPTAGAIYIVRDPRDIAISYAAHMSISIDAAIDQMGAKKMPLSNGAIFQVISDWSTNVESWISKAHFPVLTVKYESLLAGAIVEFDRVLTFLGIDLDHDRLYRAAEATQFDALQSFEADHGFRERKGDDPFFRLGTAGQWRDVLDRNQIARIESRHGDMMRRVGYGLQGEMVA